MQTSQDPATTVRCRALDAEEARLAELTESAPASVAAMFRDRVARTPDLEAFRAPDGRGGWVSRTWKQTGAIVEELAAGLIALGVQPQERVAIAAGTRVEWVHADLAVMCAGSATTTVYPTSPPSDVEHILRDSASCVVIAEDAGQLAKVAEHLGTLPDLRQAVLSTPRTRGYRPRPACRRGHCRTCSSSAGTTWPGIPRRWRSGRPPSARRISPR